MRGLHRLTSVALVLTFALMVIGAMVRVTGSGLACPDWPRCYGMWLPTPAKLAAITEVSYTFGQVMLEWTHRLFAGVIVAFVAIMCVWALRRRRLGRALVPLMATAMILLLIQGGLGALTVFEHNSPESVVAHLTIALLFFAALIRVFLVSQRLIGFDASPDRPIRGLRPATGVALAAALLTAASGAMTAASGASLACDSWPLCGGDVSDLDHTLVRIHFGHRLLALTSVLLIAGLLAFAWTRRLDAPHFLRDMATAAVLSLIQVALGAAVVLTGVSPWTAIVHQAVGILTFAALAVAYWRPLVRRPTFAHG